MGVLIFIDQITKYLARRDLADESYAVIDKVFRFSLVKNKGAAWGILQGKVDILSIISIAMVILIAVFFFRVPSDKKFNIIRILCIFVISGAIGNVIDRIGFGFVTDFLYIQLIDFPVFNIADCYITFSMVIFIFLMLFCYKDENLDFLSFRKKKSEDKPEEASEEENTENEGN